ncbi:MAG: GNAT family N-acetyltransferase, partial [Jatrophihabitans sp.]
MGITLRSQPAGRDLTLLAFDGDRRVGSAVLCARPVTRLAGAAYPHLPQLAYLQVEPAAQGHGVGTALIGYGEQVARERGAAAVAIGVTRDDPRARALYERLGYRPTGVIDSYSYRAALPDGTTPTRTETAETLRKVLHPVPATVPEVVAAVARLAATREGQTRWVGVDGWGAAGKTSLAAAIAAAVPGAA